MPTFQRGGVYRQGARDTKEPVPRRPVKLWSITLRQTTITGVGCLRKRSALMPVELSHDPLLSRLRPELFWDVDLNRLDSGRHANFIIERVAERGNLDEMRLTWSYYGPDRVRQALQVARGLTPKTVAFFANLFGTPLESFRSYRQGSSDVIPV